MAYRTIGSVVKSKKPGENDYIKITEDVVLKKGEYLSLDTKTSKLSSVQKALENGRLSEEIASKITEKIEKTPWLDKDKPDTFVRFEISKKD